MYAKYILYFIFILPVSSQENFCGTFCICSTSTVLCRGVSQFPQFESTYWIKTLTIVSSRLRVIPTFRQFEFVSLREIRFIDCANIDCEDVEQLIQARPSLIISVGRPCGATTHQSSTVTSFITTIQTLTTTAQTTTRQPSTVIPFSRQITHSTTDYTTSQRDVTTSSLTSTALPFSPPNSIATPLPDTDIQNEKSAKNISVVSIVVSVLSVVIMILFITFVSYKIKRRIRRRNIVRLDNIPLHHLRRTTETSHC